LYTELEKTGQELLVTCFRALYWQTEENHQILSYDIWYPNQDMNQVSCGWRVFSL